MGYKNESEILPTDIERKYWNEIKERTFIQTDLIQPSPRFFCCKRVTWYHPLNCEWCYPENLIDERALVETDVTSTVPSQQLEVGMDSIFKKEEGKKIQNEERLIALKECIYYGHICRDNNHFQYYVDTNKYFNKQKADIVKWLKELRKNDNELLVQEEMSDVLNIIITPQHHTNVEFCHYVNEHFFDGSADIITVDSAKEYRSNIIAKYADIKCAISEARNLNTKVMFSYVDDTIITGTTFHRVNNLVHSLIPEKDIKSVQFDRVFVLVNRLSQYSKKDYVQDTQKNFIAYVDINVSSVRNFGDSCAMCTLERDSELFAHRASTRVLSTHWYKKKYAYRKVSFDKYPWDKEVLKTGYIRLLCSHYAKSSMHISRDKEKSILEITKLILDIKNDEANVAGNNSLLYEKVFRPAAKSTIQSFLKVLCRPFFSYGKIYRQVILDLFLLLAQCFIMPGFYNNLKDFSIKNISVKKAYLNSNRVRSKIAELYEFISSFVSVEEWVDFILDYILEGLTDLRSNYLIRYETMIYMKRIIEESDNKNQKYEKYEQFIFRIINGSSDETKSLWLEKMLYTGVENKTYMDEEEQIILKKSEEEKEFALFWDSLFINNNRLYYDSMLNFLDKVNRENDLGQLQEEAIGKAVNDLWNDYYIQNLRKFINLEIQADNKQISEEIADKKIKERIIKSAKLLFLLKTETANGIERYKKLKEYMQDMLYEEDRLFIITKATEEEEYCSVVDYESGNLPVKIIMHMQEAIGKETLNSKGFFVGKGYILICIDNDYQKLENERKEAHEKGVEVRPMYFYVKCDTRNLLRVKLRIRYLLMYRHQLLKWIEADFNNNAMPIIAMKTISNKQLIRDKAGDHSSRQDIAVNHRLLQSELMTQVVKNGDDNQKLYIWLLFRSYVNMRVARLFRSEWSESTNKQVYTRDKNADRMNGPLINLAESFFGNRLGTLSPRRYFEFVSDVFQFDICMNGTVIENASINDIKMLFENLYGREKDGYFYKEEFIICIVFDILFSAIKNWENWEISCNKFCDKNIFEDVFTDTDACVAYLFELKEAKEKCRICISIEEIKDKEVQYLVLKNRVYGIKHPEEVKQANEELQSKLQTKETVGLSIQTIQWYTEGLDLQAGVLAKFEYVWNEKRKEAEFITKLPILKGGQ